MKTPRKDSRLASRNQSDSALQIRRKRVLTAFACESLEGRKLMTGFAGASAAMMGTSPAEMGSMGGDNYDRSDLHRFDGGSATVGTDSSQTATGQSGSLGTDASQTMASQTGSTASSDTAASDQMGIRSFLRKDDMQASPDSAMGLRGDRASGVDSAAEGDMGGSGFGSDFPGDSMGFGPRGNGGELDRGLTNVPMSGQSGMGDQGASSSGNTQLDTDRTKLQTDAQAIHDKSQVTPALLATVRKDNEAIDKAATGTADATALKTQQTDEQTIFSSQTAPTDAQQTQLQADRDAVLKSQGVSQTLIDQLAADRLAVKTASNFTTADQATLDADHKAIDADRTAPTSNDSSSTASTTAMTTTATPAGSTTATPAVATPATPDATSVPVMPAATSTAPPAMTTIDPTTTQTTSTAAPMVSTMAGANSDMSHHGRAGINQAFANHQGHSMGVGQSLAGHQGGLGHNVVHTSSIGGRGVRAVRG